MRILKATLNDSLLLFLWKQKTIREMTLIHESWSMPEWDKRRIHRVQFVEIRFEIDNFFIPNNLDSVTFRIDPHELKFWFYWNRKNDWNDRKQFFHWVSSYISQFHGGIHGLKVTHFFAQSMIATRTQAILRWRIHFEIPLRRAFWISFENDLN